MKTMQVREAKAGFSALVEAAENGEPTIITKHGKPAAAIVSVEDMQKLYPVKRRNFGEFLLTYPGGIELERNPSPSRDIDL
ncbi:type II toxin-antitoxin system Phd/YefM family antitoxin [Mesorhizobium sp. M7A.F.Ca.CA.001.09.2.1]|uniref:Antitoxin n=1 Tax=Mesorhizobium ciceri TaxID=39645 RepID=A0AB38TD85_9HYPH|nr:MULTISPECIES: type II toxin-antitoxin system Phd/YefM family antitoxin [Mesorhizobium]RUY47938.1 type II toxin-antitoxin system Phd/YefM family antitoxin [Mesorhizobium sp. M7A.F.Ca.CA.001.13.2.1]RVA53373.1 type II toxin-antitoxin system Phd/YefM family antitoxin [Mesorhizobium sp. M7A.F.Ca.US.001.01.1.1]MDF3215461.1 type II toxin-antitoxin system Phd/YefM family antitoxin [Mesorhizobium ciceri]RUY72183.1 type II toxin-antitoxin system Phd/YefM family antitoxin [Mesorhizobium sp. M7A.F.Ca.CA